MLVWHKINITPIATHSIANLLGKDVVIVIKNHAHAHPWRIYHVNLAPNGQDGVIGHQLFGSDAGTIDDQVVAFVGQLQKMESGAAYIYLLIENNT